MTTLSDRFWAKVDKSADGCWNWTASLTRGGYGKLAVDARRSVKTFGDAHRVSWQLHFGDIPEGLYVCHRCDNRRCVRPDHLFLGSAADNMQDCKAKGRNSHNLPRTHCPKGHEFTQANTYITTKGARVCRECGRIATRAWDHATRQARLQSRQAEGQTLRPIHS